MSERIIVAYKKDCDCRDATATTGQYRYGLLRIKNDTVMQTIDFIPGPSCDECGKAWRQLEPPVYKPEPVWWRIVGNV